MKSYTITVNGNVCDVTVEEALALQLGSSTEAAPKAAPRQLRQHRRQQLRQQARAL